MVSQIMTEGIFRVCNSNAVSLRSVNDKYANEEYVVFTLILGDKGLSVCSTPFRAYPSRKDT
jgi:hypothetical protein